MKRVLLAASVVVVAAVVLFLGIAFFFVAGLDLLHALAYKGTGIFLGADTDLPTQLWIAARYLESVTLLVAPRFLGRRFSSHRVFAGFLIVFAVLLVGFQFANLFCNVLFNYLFNDVIPPEFLARVHKEIAKLGEEVKRADCACL